VARPYGRGQVAVPRSSVQCHQNPMCVSSVASVEWQQTDEQTDMEDEGASMLDVSIRLHSDARSRHQRGNTYSCRMSSTHHRWECQRAGKGSRMKS